MSTQGRDVTLQSSDFHLPSRCASCGAPPQTSLYAKKKKGLWGGGSVTRSFQIPYCQPCADRARGAHTKSVAFTVVTLVLGVALAALTFAMPTLHVAILIGVPTLAALAFSLLAITALKPRAPALPAMAAGDAVKLVSFDGERSTLHCQNPHWAEELAQSNGVQAVPASRGAGFALGSLVAALIGAPVVAALAWGVSHPQVYVDDAGPEPLQIWIDGKPASIVSSNVAGAPPPFVFTPFGKRTLGWSKVGAAQPEGTALANVSMMDAHLYNPSRTACYWLIASSYGTASVAGIAQGPQSIQEFYSFDKISTWFGDNPQSVEVQDGQTGDTRVAIQRSKVCMELAAKGCDVAAREGYVKCQQASKTKVEFEKCDDSLACAGAAPTSPAVAAAAGHAPTAHPTAATHTPRPVRQTCPGRLGGAAQEEEVASCTRSVRRAGRPGWDCRPDPPR